MTNLVGPFTHGGTYVVDARGEIACSTASDADAVRIAADLNLADSLIHSISARPRAKVLKFDLDRIPVEDRLDAVEHVYGETLGGLRWRRPGHD